MQAFFALLRSVDDTNLLHRGGADGLAFARREASRFLVEGVGGRDGGNGPLACTGRSSRDASVPAGVRTCWR